MSALPISTRLLLSYLLVAVLPLGEWALDPEHTGSAGCDRTCGSPFKWDIAILD